MVRIKRPARSSSPPTIRYRRPQHSKAHHNDQPRPADPPFLCPRRSIQCSKERTDDNRTDRAPEAHGVLNEAVTSPKGGPGPRSRSGGPSCRPSGSVSFDGEHRDTIRDRCDLRRCEDEPETGPDTDLGRLHGGRNASPGSQHRGDIGIHRRAGKSKHVEQWQKCDRPDSEIHACVVRRGVVELTWDVGHRNEP